MMKKKVLLLGAGNAQIDAIRYCKDNDLTLFGCSYTDTDRGIPLLDHFEKINITNIDEVTNFAHKNNVDIVYSVGSDVAMPTVSKVSENLNLPHFISYETSLICTNKYMLRSFLGDDFNGNIRNIAAKTIDDAKKFNIFPLVMKPVDSQGQRGVYKITTPEEINLYFNKSMEHSRCKNIILEQYIDGPEISVNAYIQNGVIKFSLISDRNVFSEFPGGIIKEHLVPSSITDPDTINNINTLVRNTVSKLSIINGPVYFQIKVCDGKAYLVEVTPRLDGCHMWNLIKNYCGVDLMEITFQHLIFNKEVKLSLSPNKNTYKLSFMCQPTGSKVDRENFNLKDAHYIDWYYNSGDIVRKLNGYMEKCGYNIVRV